MNDKLFLYKEQGLLTCQEHPTLDLRIWNYTPKVQYERLWDGITIICRGLVTDFAGNIVSRGFPKFFNIEEGLHNPTPDFEVFEKLDGQYIGVFLHNGQMVVNGRGSFTSQYAMAAERILHDSYPEFKECMIPYITYCFELIGYEQIVVKYTQEDLILTGTFHCSGISNYIFDDQDYYLGGVIRVAKYDGLDYRNIKSLNWKNAEGFVVRFANGDRCKIKFADYVRLHGIMTNISEKKIWKALYDGVPISSILEDVPDEFYEMVHSNEDMYREKYREIEDGARIRYEFERKQATSQKEFAQNLENYMSRHIVFAMDRGKDYSKMIWKLLEPKNIR